MDFLIPSKKVSKCPDCSGSGYVALEDETLTLNSEYAIEIGCKACKGKGKIVKRIDLSLESLKDLINGLK